MPLSYNGWVASQDPNAIGINTEWEPIPNHRFPGGVKAGDVETVLTYVVRQLDLRVEPIDRDAIKDEWGYAYKPSANSPNTLSCHSSGTAFDYNATRHPNGHRGTFSPAQVGVIRLILAEVDGVVRWLGDATRVADEMHFEIHGTPAEVAAVAMRLRRQAAGQIPAEPVEEDDMAYIATRKSPVSGTYVVHPNRLDQLPTQEDVNSAVAALGPVVKLSADAWDVLVKDRKVYKA